MTRYVPPMFNKLRRAVEKAVAPGAVLSYSQSGEDLVLDFLVGYRSTGFYVDVGANNPVRGSNTFRFYRKGWRGICIDAADFGSRFRVKRPRDQFIRSCVSDVPRTVTFHHFAHDTLSSISGERLYDNADHYALKGTEEMATMNLPDILRQAGCPTEFDILSIDVEGEPVSFAGFAPQIC